MKARLIVVAIATVLTCIFSRTQVCAEPPAGAYFVPGIPYWIPPWVPADWFDPEAPWYQPENPPPGSPGHWSEPIVVPGFVIPPAWYPNGTEPWLVPIYWNDPFHLRPMLPMAPGGGTHYYGTPTFM